ncbi:MAG: RluA family pseudouridine synthase [Caulobacterales bacterium]|nr:RluA family pseudouridine synthase [Caulobacterales bacterium]MCA0372851.1 RluA family pseudouridine synthase [Pseudomonadota bacterium]
MRKPAFKPAQIKNQLSQDDIDYIKSLVIYEDETCIVFNKPSGLAVQGGSGVSRDLDNLLNAFCKNPKKKPKLVHRIDRETSGIVLVAKNKTNAAFYSEQFAQKHAKKIYYAIVSGVPNPPNGIIDIPLKRGKVQGIDLALIAKPNDKDAQNAITHYESVKTNGNATLLKLSPITGRMHQLRAHLSHIGHPILGDNKYGGLLFANNKSIKRLMLHALTLQIKLPEGSEIEHKTTLPEDFSNLME